MASEPWDNGTFEWMPQPEENLDMSWGDIPFPAVKPDLSMSSSGTSNFYVPFEEFEQMFYPSPDSQPQHPSSESSFAGSLLSDRSSPSTSETISDRPTSETQSPSPPSTGPAFKCRFCADTFEKRHLLNRHENKHTKPVPCPVSGCPHRTAKRRDMQRHVVVHHSHEAPVAVPKFLCPVGGCKYAEAGFKRKDHLVRHLERKHP
ncbi:uncharacterized protein LY89DRAFT_375069 [Mollisia scopiformis]|uniref:C2H2-type domain-containing protein n=1 Tax=Mollisia scopiformis TaxID=149040 RepID=A0A132B3P1_MOLSC|nr:uncharacterized protein LY89DRAFT_375069 [Mollisia scopiformis]KUJ07006.1 hypothetical protein LY89DRAFT_375069 [Mollisia scopiformis]